MKRCEKCGRYFGGIVCECSFQRLDPNPQRFERGDDNTWKRFLLSGDKPNEYVCGFLFQHYDNSVVLIEKKRPEWQAGKLNGVGGHIKHGESAAQAMSREFFEEAGALIPPDYWTEFFTASYHIGTTVHFFKCLDPHTNYEISTQTDEIALNYPLAMVETGGFVIPNLKWLVPMALEGSRFMAHESTPFASA